VELLDTRILKLERPGAVGVRYGTTQRTLSLAREGNFAEIDW
jgi:hypothetical protein